MPKPGEAPDDLAQHQRCSVSVLDVGGVDHGVDQIARGVGEDVALAAPDLLARVIATRFAGFPMTGRLGWYAVMERNTLTVTGAVGERVSGGIDVRP